MKKNGKGKGVGITLKRLRLEKAKISQETLAYRLGKTQSEVSRLEKRKGISLETLFKLSKALEIEPGDFIDALVEDGVYQ